LQEVELTVSKYQVGKVLILIVAVSLNIILGCFTSLWAESSQKLIAPEKVTAVIHCNYAPVTFWDKNTDKPSGFAVDILNNAAKRANLEVSYICKPGWPEILTSLETGEATISVLLKSPDREKIFLFSSPIDIAYLSYFARSQSRINPNTMPRGYTVGVIKGSRSYEYLNNQPRVNLSLEGTYPEGIFSLLAGQIDIFAGEESLINKHARETLLEDRIKKIGKPFSEQERCLVVSKNNVQLQKRLNIALKGFVGSPEYQRIYLTWYGSPLPYWTTKRIFMASGLILFISICGMAYWRYKSIIRINRELLFIIDEHRRTEERLRLSEAELKEAQTIARMGRWELDLFKNSLKWSDTIFDIIEIDQTQFGATYETFLETIHPDDREMVNEAYNNSLKSKQPYEITHRLLMKDGRVKWVSEVCKTDYNQQGHAMRSVGTVQDITERKLTEDKIQQSEMKYRNLFELSRDGIFLLDFDGNFIDVNSTAYTRLGYTKEEMLALHISKLAHPKFATQTIERMKQIRNDGFAVFESAHLRKDGTAMPVEVNSRRMEYQGRMVHFSMIRDITERNRAEEAMRESEKRDRKSVV
jgi:PAS domain S-box-containing protein